ncbi:MAG: hypothetical protein ACO26U_05190 [Burkholderiaceae bacterium]
MIEIVIKKLLEEKSLVAHETLEKPGDGSPFEFGRRAGMYAGLNRAMELIDQVLAGEEGDDEHDQRRRAGDWWKKHR